MQPLLTPRALGQLLGIAEQTIYNRHSANRDLPPALKLGRLLRFRPCDVEAWLTRRQEPPTTVSTTGSVEPRRRPGRPTKREQIARRTR